MQALPTLTECHHFLRSDAPSAVLSSVHSAMPVTNAHEVISHSSQNQASLLPQSGTYEQSGFCLCSGCTF